MKLRILIADGHEVVRRGGRALLADDPEWDVCGDATTGREAIDGGGHAACMDRGVRGAFERNFFKWN
jgi:DNA-binding NarL/FixJ family response regulator